MGAVVKHTCGKQKEKPILSLHGSKNKNRKESCLLVKDSKTGSSTVVPGTYMSISCCNNICFPDVASGQEILHPPSLFTLYLISTTLGMLVCIYLANIHHSDVGGV